MPWIRWLGIIPLRLSERDFLAKVVRGGSFRLLTAGDRLSGGIAGGFPDFSGAQQVGQAKKCIREMSRDAALVADALLRDKIAVLVDKTEALIAINDEAVTFVIRYTGKRDLSPKQLSRYFVSKQFSADYPSGPTWAREPEYLPLRRRSMSALDSAWLLDRDIAARVRELVEGSGATFVDAAARYAPIPRPADQLRGAIEAMRQEIRTASDALSASAGKLAGLGMADLPPRSKKDITAK
jgi:hypothetical protein